MQKMSAGMHCILNQLTTQIYLLYSCPPLKFKQSKQPSAQIASEFTFLVYSKTICVKSIFYNSKSDEIDTKIKKQLMKNYLSG